VNDENYIANPIIEIFYSDVTHQMRVSLFKEDVALEVVEWAISLAHKRLPVSPSEET